MYKKVRHLSASRTSWIQSTTSHHITLRTIFILPYLRLTFQMVVYLLDSPSKPTRVTCPTHLILFDLIAPVVSGKECTPWSTSLCSFFSLLSLHRSYPQVSTSAPYSRTPSGYVSPSVWQTNFHTPTKQTKLQFCRAWTFILLDSKLEDKDLGPNGSRHCLSLACSWYLLQAVLVCRIRWQR